MLGVKKKTSRFCQVMDVFSVCGFCHSALQSFKCVCVCVWSMDTRCVHKSIL